ncbi:DUF72 domain-containing protein [Sporolactobacillus shoreae]|uniref:DUF72 domain-containing protein n=1 Tax=Sporolactobacillus shoreae TaxID=1465501 RepID=A0A4Z0GSN1_9BACL|nr:DUF72 domain-containing protein [Sporolactobacillus shoreae]TGB00404.1 DUF72 domain-containing protein [Sporolactobacillus shoreae]
MNWIGLTGWGDHPSLYESGTKSSKLESYCSHFPIVESDSSFYAIQPEKNYRNWVNETPDNFRFIVKAYQGMTGHLRGKTSFKNIGEMFDTFCSSIDPLLQSGKCTMVLFQYPPWFDCTAENIEKLRYTKKKMSGIPVALEFRNPSWFLPETKMKTLSFIEREGWTHTICDEPQTDTGSIPLVLSGWGDSVLIRLHGRNTAGWLNHGPNWRKVRCLYRYDSKELNEWKQRLMILNQKVKNVYMLFNNNSGGDAADNAKQMIDMLDLSYSGLAPKQLGLF